MIFSFISLCISFYNLPWEKILKNVSCFYGYMILPNFNAIIEIKFHSDSGDERVDAY